MRAFLLLSLALGACQGPPTLCAYQRETERLFQELSAREQAEVRHRLKLHEVSGRLERNVARRLRLRVSR